MPRNEVVLRVDGDDVTCALKLLKNEIGSGLSVMIVDQNGRICEGKIKSCNFSDKSCKFYNTLAISNEKGQLITDTGDSGALVMCRNYSAPPEPAAAEAVATDEAPSRLSVMHVVGIVTGKWRRSHEGFRAFESATIANRLWDVLQAVGSNTDHWRLITEGTGTNACAALDSIDFA